MQTIRIAILFCVLTALTGHASYSQPTYAEKLGFPKGSRVLILHVDDVGMSWDSNKGAIEAIEQGVATSLSIMMPCPWVPGFVRYMKSRPGIDAGLHLTLTSEWDDYRWFPLSGKPATPGLVDQEGAFWKSVSDVVRHASTEEVDREIRAQIERARVMGFEPTHLDSHMGTLFATPEFLQRYVRIGIEEKIPVMIPAGHCSLIGSQMDLPPSTKTAFQQIGMQLWSAGLPVLDDLHNFSYTWDYSGVPDDEKAHQRFATEKYKETLRQTKPGLTMVIMHCTHPSEIFPHISDSGKIRKGDLLAMVDPELRKFIQQEGFILTTWREISERRKKAK